MTSEYVFQMISYSGFYFITQLMLIILLPAGTSIVLPVGYMNQPTGLLHIHIPLEEVMWQAGEEVIPQEVI